MTTRDGNTGKIEIKIGPVSFSAEGEQEWLGQQLNTVIEAAMKSGDTLGETVEKPISANGTVANKNIHVNHSMSLVSYLKEKNADRNQIMRFLATAGWLRCRGKKEISTSDVSKTLSEHHQKRLANASDCLNKNVAKGLCEKKGKLFFITPEGLKVLGDDHGAC
ncbi:MAG: hypothetical protein MN733_11350 [Nitrososphaera sp.]|nr:hypothetical protein [Nitrososphaera sp.]